MAIGARKADPNDVTWAELLTRQNMDVYRSARGLTWNTDVFVASWSQTENFVLLLGDSIVGFFRFVPEPKSLYLRDIQVFPRYQHQGVGTFAVEYVECLARKSGITSLRLRVFKENPAYHLYLRLGFSLVGQDDGGLLRLEKTAA